MDKEPEIYEEIALGGPYFGWVVVLGLSAFMIVMGMFLHAMIPDTPRQWDFGVLPDTPGESVYSTLEPEVRELAPLENDVVPRQLAPLPWAKPQKPLDPKGYEQTRRFNE
uniref:Uncharacterized protein n=1 Tax=Desulfovibrio sp. U5L TaxID=596152 RepID=I2Q385_9BACT